MSMATVLDQQTHQRFKKRLPMKASKPALGTAAVSVSAGGTVYSPKQSSAAKWTNAQLLTAGPAIKNKLPPPKQQLSGKNSMTKAQ